jgi:DNA-binding CsgD family transcriptional regulator
MDKPHPQIAFAEKPGLISLKTRKDISEIFACESLLNPLEGLHSKLSFNTFNSREMIYNFLEIILEGLQYAFIVVNQLGVIKKISASARNICELLESEGNELPSEIWKVCQSALIKKDILIREKIVIDAEVTLKTEKFAHVHVHHVQIVQETCLLIILEDYQRTIRNKVLSDAVLFNLTRRETEVWKLRLQCAGYSEISVALEISENTVKKHIKNILAKRRAHLKG